MIPSSALSSETLKAQAKRFSLPTLPYPVQDAELSVTVTDNARPLVLALLSGNTLEVLQCLATRTLKPTPEAIQNDIIVPALQQARQWLIAGAMPLPYVLQVAESVARLRELAGIHPQSLNLGNVVMATVDGDVHEVGKNLSLILLQSHGYTTLNLGPSVSFDTLLANVQEHQPTAIVLSGLLMSSAQTMVSYLKQLDALNLSIPVVLGGPCLWPAFVEEQCRPAYRGKVYHARLAFDVIDALTDISSPEAANPLPPASLPAMSMDAMMPAQPEAEASTPPAPRSQVRQNEPLPSTPFYGVRQATLPLERVFAFLNDRVLYTGHWGFRRGSASPAEHEAWLDTTVAPVLTALKEQALSLEGILTPKVTYGFFSIQAEGDTLHLYATPESNEILTSFHFPRGGTKNLCLVDYVRPIESGERDVIALQLVTMGSGACEFSHQLLQQQRYRDYFFFHGFSVELAEALAEAWHADVRQQWGITAKEAGKQPKELMKPSAYQGCRYSFGYPACPNLEDQTKLMALLQPEAVGVVLSAGLMLVPEQSTSALVFHHPEAHYFDVGGYMM